MLQIRLNSFFQESKYCEPRLCSAILQNEECILVIVDFLRVCYFLIKAEELLSMDIFERFGLATQNSMQSILGKEEVRWSVDGCCPPASGRSIPFPNACRL